jgi:hypothetical protein
MLRRLLLSFAALFAFVAIDRPLTRWHNSAAMASGLPWLGLSLLLAMATIVVLYISFWKGHEAGKVGFLLAFCGALATAGFEKNMGQMFGSAVVGLLLFSYPIISLLREIHVDQSINKKKLFAAATIAHLLATSPFFIYSLSHASSPPRSLVSSLTLCAMPLPFIATAAGLLNSALVLLVQRVTRRFYVAVFAYYLGLWMAIQLWQNVADGVAFTTMLLLNEITICLASAILVSLLYRVLPSFGSLKAIRSGLFRRTGDATSASAAKTAIRSEDGGRTEDKYDRRIEAPRTGS